MPYKSDAQRRYFNANRDELEAEGVDVDEWNKSSKGKKLPEKVTKQGSTMNAIQELAKQAANEGQAASLGALTGGGIGAGLGAASGLGAALGAGAGGVAGMFTDPGENEEGQKKSRMLHMLKSMGIGGVGGGLAGAGLATLPLAGAAGGAALGGLGGAGIGHAMGPQPPSNSSQEIKDAFRGFMNR